MKILIAHNRYQNSGGEDAVVEQESRLLSSNGHNVSTIFFDNCSLTSIPAKISAGLRVVRNSEAVAELMELVRAQVPDVVHIHNFFPLLSPSALAAVADAGIPVIQTLHNYRVICPGALLMRKGRPCETCVGASRLGAILHRCYRQSVIGTMATARMGRAFKAIVARRRDRITLVALSQFAKGRFVADGISADQIVVKPNFRFDPGVARGERTPRLLYVGRLSAEKGVETVIHAAAGLDVEVEIVGDGPEAASLKAIASPNVRFLGALPNSVVVERIKAARALLIPSRCYEGFPMTVVEAMSTGTPIIASALGSLNEIIDHDVNGLLLPPLDLRAWSLAMARTKAEPDVFERLGAEARSTYEQSYTPEIALRRLTEIYAAARSRLEASIEERLI